MPVFSVLQKTNLQQACWHAMLISLLRGLAALQVAAAHLRAQVFQGYRTVEAPPLLFKGLAFSSGFAYLAVIVFFVLSGWLVGGSFLNKLDTDRPFLQYAIDRMSRLWIVLVPTFFVVLLIGAAIGILTPARLSLSTNEAYSVSAFIGNLVGLQTILLPPFGDNFPLWSLANEIWYYVLFPLLVLIFHGSTLMVRIAALLAAFAIAQWLPAAILLYFSIWLLGVVFSRVRIDAGPVWRWALFLLVAGSAIYIRLYGRSDITPDSYPQYLLFSVAFVLFLSSMQFERPAHPVLDRIDQVGRFFSNFSFTLYVLHVPMIVAMAYVLAALGDISKLSPDLLSHYLIYLAMYVTLVVLAYWFYLPFEANTGGLRQWLKSQLFTRVAPAQP